MTAGNQAIPGQQETALLDYAERLRRSRTGRIAIHARLSRLRQSNRQAERLNLAAQAFDSLVSTYDGALFRLHNGDIVAVCKNATKDAIAAALTRVRSLFKDDAAVIDDDPQESEFFRQYDLNTSYNNFMQVAREALEAARKPAASNTSAAPARAQRALDPKTLAAIQTAIARADLTNVIRRQCICAVQPGKPPQPVFTEVFTSMAALRDILTPGIDIYANRWLFLDLTAHLDRRVLSFLGHKDDSTLSKAFSVNLHIASLAAPEFLAFDQKLTAESRKSVIIEMQPIDVLADIDAFEFTRNFLRERNYRFCLDGLTYQSLPAINCKRLNVDLVKIVWSPELHRDATRGDGAIVEAVKAIGPGRVILTRCDDEMVFQTGKALGTSLYQGYLIDSMLKSAKAKPPA